MSCYKGNFDATLFDGSNCAGIRVVFRDPSGSVIVALSKKIGSTHLIEMAEALAARRAVVLANELSLFDGIIEGDCLWVTQALNCSGRRKLCLVVLLKKPRSFGACCGNASLNMFVTKGIG